ncbi:MAG: LysR family transcriptional regulator [Pseudomonadota bacterium]
MKTPLDWSDLALFASVARAGSLAAAAEASGTSVATLSRRMRALEVQAGRQLFLHGSAGYQLSRDGRALLQKMDGMERAAAGIATWQARAGQAARVRISAGTWTGHALARALPRIWSPNASWLPEFLQSNNVMDLARGEIDIGIRNARPEQPWLAGRRTNTIHYAVYAKGPEITAWIGAARDGAATRSAAWVERHHGSEIATTANDPQLALAMAEAGLGRVVLPCFIGDGRAGLQRLGDPIEELQSEEWLVSHQDARHQAPIRATLNALARYLSAPDRFA